MADNPTMDIPSLVNLVSLKGAGQGAKSDAKLRQMAAQTASRGFDGFLQTFLGKGKASRRASGFGSRDKSGDALSGKRCTQNYGRYGNVNPGSSMSAADKAALRQSMEKTADDDEAGEDVAEAADEAARMICDMLFGGGQGGGGPLGQLAGGGGMGSAAPGMSTDWQQALDTANASAEMNNAATLQALDDLLDGLPRGALEDALGRALGLQGPAGGLINQLASALDARVVSVGGGEASMLAYLRGTSGMVPGGYEDPAAPRLFADFLKETGVDSPINTMDSPDAAEAGDELLAVFEQWLQASGKSPEAASALSGDVNKFVQSLAGHLRGDQTEMPEDMAEMLHAWLRGGGDMRGGAGGSSSGGGFQNAFAMAEGLVRQLADAATSDSEGGESDADGGPAALSGAQPGQQAGDAAKVAPVTPAASMSTMMEQIENIERLADAMRMAARGGIKNLTMQLTPDELGKVMLRVEAKDGVVSAYLRVEKPEAAAQLANNLQQLRENLKAQGIELGNFDIQLRGRDEALGDFGGGGRGRERDPGDSSGQAARHAVESISGSAPPLPDDGPAEAGGPGELNLFA